MRKYIYLISSLVIILTLTFYSSGNLAAFQSSDPEEDIFCGDVCNDVCYATTFEPCTNAWCTNDVENEPASSNTYYGEKKNQTDPAVN